MIDHIDGDYFVDCQLASQSFLRAAFGVWISIYAGVIAYCVRLAAAVVSAASTTIANHAVVKHSVIRRRDVSGRLAQRDSLVVLGLNDRATQRAEALKRAQAPLDQLFDFIPDDDSDWVFVTEEWNNTWQGECTFHKYAAVDLVVFKTSSTSYQDLVPALGAFLPHWATVDPTKQGFSLMASLQSQTTNDTGACRDCLLTYAFGSASYFPNNESLPTTNISFANILLHDIGMAVETAFKSDVHVVECTFNHDSPGEDQVRADAGLYNETAIAIGSVNLTNVAEQSAQGQVVIQQTAQEMLRYWQAYMMVTHGYFIHPVRRKLSVSLEMVQLRLSAVFVTVITFVLAVAAAIVAHFNEPLDEHGERINLPNSQLDWTVEAARQRYVEGHHKSRIDYVKHHEDLFYTVSSSGPGLSRITSNRDKSITQPFMGDFDPNSPHGNPNLGVSAASTSGHAFPDTKEVV